ncbi:hypothetical protein PIB30_039243 [Stylosanthes scabra]|uniref:Transmembrane protein n=1 Tax=Stylosanthes scabra TaxID=79078 RepID=A0ABU6UCW1_9FABA|nr:hypothetical protein [Stylosanthes scabra]
MLNDSSSKQVAFWLNIGEVVGHCLCRKTTTQSGLKETLENEKCYELFPIIGIHKSSFSSWLPRTTRYFDDGDHKKKKNKKEGNKLKQLHFVDFSSCEDASGARHVRVYVLVFCFFCYNFGGNCFHFYFSFLFVASSFGLKLYIYRTPFAHGVHACVMETCASIVFIFVIFLFVLVGEYEYNHPLFL